MAPPDNAAGFTGRPRLGMRRSLLSKFNLKSITNAPSNVATVPFGPAVATTTHRYNGSKRRLVIAFDVGTTFSGVSYCILEPGEVPKTFSVTRCVNQHQERPALTKGSSYPGQEHDSGSSKIPSILFYDREGKCRAAGAEALLDGTAERAEDERWVKSEWCVLTSIVCCAVLLKTTTGSKSDYGQVLCHSL